MMQFGFCRIWRRGWPSGGPGGAPGGFRPGGAPERTASSRSFGRSRAQGRQALPHVHKGHPAQQARPGGRNTGHTGRPASPWRRFRRLGDPAGQQQVLTKGWGYAILSPTAFRRTTAPGYSGSIGLLQQKGSLARPTTGARCGPGAWAPAAALDYF